MNNRSNLSSSITKEKQNQTVNNVMNLPPNIAKTVEMASSLEVKPKPQISKDLKDLLLFGKMSETFTFGNASFELETLSVIQQKNIIKELSKLDVIEQRLSSKIYILADAIKSINGKDLASFINAETISFAEKVEIVSSFQALLVEKLYEKYEKMIEASNKLFEDPEVPEKIKN